MRTASVRSRAHLAVAAAVWQGSSTSLPEPPQRGQVRSMEKKPWLARTRPAPLQVAQVVGLEPGAQPEPSQASQVRAAGTLISTWRRRRPARG